jgi:hypothetical protein
VPRKQEGATGEREEWAQEGAEEGVGLSKGHAWARWHACEWSSEPRGAACLWSSTMPCWWRSDSSH